MKKFYAQHQQVGPGGIHCPCCNDYAGPPRKWVSKVRRKARRKLKQQLKIEVDC